MKTFSISITIAGKITVPDSITRDLRVQSVDGPEYGGDRFLYELSKRTEGNDDEFVQAALRNALRNIVRNGIVNDIANMGVGVKCAPAQVAVSVPERVVTRIQSKEQVGVERIDVQPLGFTEGLADELRPGQF